MSIAWVFVGIFLVTEAFISMVRFRDQPILYQLLRIARLGIGIACILTRLP